MTTISPDIAGPPADELDEKERKNDPRSLFVWERYNLMHSGTASPSLRRMAANARRANGREPGTEPDVWSLYRSALPDGSELRLGGAGFWAEHIAIGLWGTHQQSNSKKMHDGQTNLGAACRELYRRRNKAGTSPTKDDMADAISRRLRTLVRTDDVVTAARHMKSLVTFLGSEAVPVSYANVYFALLNWDDEKKHNVDLRRWAASYLSDKKPGTTIPKPTSTINPEGSPA